MWSSNIFLNAEVNVFDFGANWQEFSEQKLTEETFTAATAAMQKFLMRESLSGLSFLDIGCGSGIHSIIAYRLGARPVFGIDILPNCIKVSNTNAARFAVEGCLDFRQISILDSTKIDSLGTYDIVYAWGSLHHTGAMWEAIRNSAKRVNSNGLFAISIYNHHLTSSLWLHIKQFYNRFPVLQRLMVLFFGSLIYIAKWMLTRQSPLKKERGMDFWFDIVDWLGGYPYEYTTSDEIITFVSSLGFDLCQLTPSSTPIGCNEFLFKNRN